MSLYYQDDYVTLHHGDCLEIMPSLAGRSVDMILADLPYGTTRNNWDSIIDLQSMWQNYGCISKENAAIVLTAQTPFDKVLGASNLEDLRYEWIWEKTSATGHLNAKRAPMKAHENILVFYKSLPTYNPQMTSGHVRKVSTADHKRNSSGTSNYGEFGLTGYDSTDRYPRSVLEFATDKQKEALHPTQKPLALMAYLIRTYTNAGDIVLDNCAGSGSTLIAARRQGRRAVGIELDEAYCEVIATRLSQEGFEMEWTA